MIRVDLHVHSQASKRPSEWFLKKVGARESYTPIHTLYADAKARGMDFVTVTDHNTIDGALGLVETYPEDTFVSVETTTYFPENNCKIHILIFDIGPETFAKIEAVRHNIYLLRDFIKANDLAYSVAHGFYNINQRLTLEILERLILLFDVFEGLNGARNRYYNETWQQILRELTPERIQLLSAKHNITPISCDPWIKGFTGGSDDHAGIFIGQTATQSDCKLSKTAYIQSIKEKRTTAIGRCNDYKSFAFSIYKIFCDYSSNAQKELPEGILALVNDVIFERKQSRLKKWVTLRKIKKRQTTKDKITLKFFQDVYNWSDNKNLTVETKIDNIYHSMGRVLDEYFTLLLNSFATDVTRGDMGQLVKTLISCLPAFFISVPFFSSLRHLSQDRNLILALKASTQQDNTQKRVLWFTDTLTDLNGVSITLGRFRQEIIKRKLNITFVTCAGTNSPTEAADDHLMALPCIFSHTPEFYSAYTLNVPSLMASMEMIYQYRPDRMVISTPGPVGIFGMIMAHILGIEAVCIYHTDFAAQAEYLFEDEALTACIQSFINRFYSFATEVKVPTKEYIKLLEGQDYPSEKMSLFKRGITVTPLKNSLEWKKAFKEQRRIKPGTCLLWAGRVSKDKNIQFLLDLYEMALANIPDLNLILCGSGPDLEEFKKAYRSHERIHFMGFVKNEALQAYYEIADLFVFPSTTDTFGMVILEAQTKGLLALVTDVGGPQEIIEDGRTGYVLSLSDMGAWVKRIEQLDLLRRDSPEKFQRLRANCRNRMKESYNWDAALADILGQKAASLKKMAAIKTLQGRTQDLVWEVTLPRKGVA
jgi:glycosyltransferase involved in cell wall biosynthesis